MYKCSYKESKEADLIFSLKLEKARLGVKLWRGDEDIYVSKQVHSNRVILFDKMEDEEGDAIITTLVNTKIGIRTADCVPLAILGYRTVAVIHAGWRGLRDGIIENTLKMFERFEPLSHTVAFVGPSAKACCYKVGKEFEKSFLSLHIKNGSLFLDTQEEAIIKLRRGGIRKFLRLNVCTICNHKLPSYRREKTQDRMVTFAEVVS
ncbi:MAG: polyphenol oxidase family protein [Aquificaceae bacterium]